MAHYDQVWTLCRDWVILFVSSCGDVSNDNKPEKPIGTFYEEIPWWRKHVCKGNKKLVYWFVIQLYSTFFFAIQFGGVCSAEMAQITFMNNRLLFDNGRSSPWYKTWHTTKHVFVHCAQWCFHSVTLSGIFHVLFSWLTSSMCCVWFWYFLCNGVGWGIKMKHEASALHCWGALCVCVLYLLAGFRLRVRSGNQKVQARWVAYYVHVHDSIELYVRVFVCVC